MSAAWTRTGMINTVKMAIKNVSESKSFKRLLIAFSSAAYVLVLIYHSILFIYH